MGAWGMNKSWLVWNGNGSDKSMAITAGQVWHRVGAGLLLHGVVLGWSGAGEADKVRVVACVHTGAMAETWVLHGCLQG